MIPKPYLSTAELADQTEWFCVDCGTVYGKDPHACIRCGSVEVHPRRKRQ